MYRQVAVLSGGPSEEREVSLASGAAVSRGLSQAGYDVVDVDPAFGSVDIPEGVEAVFIALHGTFGEDGTVQGLLHSQGIPFTGAGPVSSRLCFDKRLTKALLVEHAVPTPAYEILRPGEPRSLPLPVVVKPPLQGSTIGIHRVFREEEWAPALKDALAFGDEVLVETYVEGAELTVSVVNGEVLPVVEVRAPDGYYDYVAKYTKGKSEYLVPAPIGDDATQRCQELALRVYALTDCRGMARVDIRLAADGTPYVLEVNTIPGFTETSLLPMAARAAGIEFPALCDSIMRSASL